MKKSLFLIPVILSAMSASAMPIHCPLYLNCSTINYFDCNPPAPFILNGNPTNFKGKQYYNFLYAVSIPVQSNTIQCFYKDDNMGTSEFSISTKYLIPVYNGNSNWNKTNLKCTAYDPAHCLVTDQGDSQ
jgi:hypothetical protein